MTVTASNRPGALRRYVEKARKSAVTRPTLAFTAVSFVEKGLLLLTVPLFTRLMTPAEYGVAAVFLTWAAVFRTTLNGNVHASLVRAYFDVDRARFPAFFSSVTVLGAAVGLAAAGLAALLPDDWLALAGMPAPLVRLAALAACGWSVVLMWQSYWKAAYAYKPYIWVTLGLAVAQIGLSVALIEAGGAGADVARIRGVFIPALALGALLLAAALRYGKALVDPAAWRYALAFSFPLIPHTISGLLLAQFDRVMIAQINGPDDAGVYTLAYHFGEVMSVLWLALNGVWVPWFFARMNAGQRALVRRRSLQYTAAFLAVTLVAAVAMPVAVHVVAAPAFAQAARIVPLIVVSGYFQFLYAFYVNVSFYHKRTAFVTLGTFGAAAVNVALNLVFLPRYGFAAAAWATLASYVLLFLFHAAIVRAMGWGRDLFSFRWLAASGAAACALAGGLYAAG